MSLEEVPGSAVDLRPQDPAQQVALDECIRALTLAPTFDRRADEYGAAIFRGMLIEGPRVLTRTELDC